MAKVNHIQTNLTAGEIDPKLKGRVDMPRYPNGADKVENAYARYQGGGERREGQRYIASTKFSGASKSRLKRYVFNVEQAYLLEFGAGYIRFFTSEGQVILDGGGINPLELVSPYTEAQALALNFTQGGDTLFIFHPEVQTHRLQRLTASAWRLSPVPWVAEPFAEIGARPNARLTLSAATVGVGRTVTASPAAPATAPTIGTAFARNGGALVTFTPPADNGGSAIDYYEVTSSPGGLTDIGGGSPILVSGLTNGVSYTFTVKAVNAQGASPASLPSNSVTPSASAPGGTITVAITPANFAADTENGTVPINGPLATSPDGVAPFTFFWELISGNGSIVMDRADLERAALRSTGFGTTNYCSLRVTMIDALGGVGSRDCNLSVTHRRQEEPPVGGGGGNRQPF